MFLKYLGWRHWTADQGGIWLVGWSFCGCRLSLWPKAVRRLSVTWTAPLQYAASGTIQVWYAFACVVALQVVPKMAFCVSDWTLNPTCRASRFTWLWRSVAKATGQLLSMMIFCRTEPTWTSRTSGEQWRTRVDWVNWALSLVPSGAD